MCVILEDRKKKFSTIWFFPFLSAFAFGCGQSLTGTYGGTEVFIVNGVRVSTPVTVSTSQINNDQITGTIISSFGKGDIQGRPDGIIANSSYTMIKNTSGALLPNSGVTCGTYIGKGTLTQQEISLTLELAVPAPQPSGTPQNNITIYCPSQRTISAVKQ